MKYKLSKARKFIVIWLTFFTIVCLINSVFALEYHFYGTLERNFLLAFLLPFVHSGVVNMACIFYVLYMAVTNRKLWKKQFNYIKQNHPEIYKLVNPWEGRECNSFKFIYKQISSMLSSVAFLKGKLDDGSDEKLNEIKFYFNLDQWLLGWAVLLVLPIWILNVILLVL